MQITRGKIPGAKKVVVYGPEGIGKSTFASRFPDPVFIDTEGSTKDMDVSRFEKPTSWQYLLDEIAYVRNNPSLCKTLVIDTIDWAEQLCIEAICDKHGKSGIEDFGYGNGYVYAKEEFGRFLNKLSEMVEAGVNVVLTAHAQLRKFEQPDELGAYDRWELKLGKKTSSQTSPLVKEWADMVLFCNYKTLSVAVDKDGKKHKAQGGRRVMYTSHHPCWDAKNRYGLPEECEFSYEVIRPILEPDRTPSQSKTEESPKVLPPSKSGADHTQKAEAAPAVDSQPEPVKEAEKPFPKQDPRIPKKLRDLMEANKVDEWDIQNVVEARGYVPQGTPIWEYDTVNPGIVDGLLVASWDQVYTAILEMREKQETPFK